MSLDSTATARMVAKYRDLISDFTSNRLSAQSFESRYLQIFKTDTDQVPSNEFDLLEKLFFAVDDYVADPELREKVGGLDDDQLRDRAEEAYSQLYGS
ncbi:colicin immunity domain-containing protein [Mycobacterium sp.]|uniref:colicin immunity domain-containing protein n=1 Tax=Mycobacterium sp. TaxID=1785 RepID=UPI003D0B12FA